MKIKLLKKHENATLPKRAHYNDAGADVYIMNNVIIEPHATVKIPLGFGIELPDGFQAIVQPRSSVASTGIITQIAPIDSGYTGEIHAIVTNTTSRNVILERDFRVGQLVIIPIVLADFVEELGNERGDKGFGEGSGK